MSSKHYHKHLTAVPLFADLDSKELDAVGALVTQIDAKDGEVLMTEGGYASEMYIVVHGTLIVTADGEQVAVLTDGDFVGELALLTHTHRNATVTAQGRAELLHIDRPSFASLLAEVPQIAVKMLPIIAQRASDR